MKRFFPQILKELRQEHNLTQTELAYNLKYTQSNVSEWEKGTVEPKATALTVIANYFGVSADFLLGLEDDFGARVPATPSSTVAPTSDPYDQKLLDVYHRLDSDMKSTLWSLLNTWVPTTSLIDNKKQHTK